MRCNPMCLLGILAKPWYVQTLASGLRGKPCSCDHKTCLPISHVYVLQAMVVGADHNYVGERWYCGTPRGKGQFREVARGRVS